MCYLKVLDLSFEKPSFIGFEMEELSFSELEWDEPTIFNTTEEASDSSTSTYDEIDDFIPHDIFNSTGINVESVEEQNSEPEFFLHDGEIDCDGEIMKNAISAYLVEVDDSAIEDGTEMRTRRAYYLVL